MITVNDLAEFMNNGDPEDPRVIRALAVAESLLAPYWEQGTFAEAVKDELTLEVAKGVFKRNETPNGQFATADGVVNVPRDPLAYVMPVLKRGIGYFG